MKTAKKQNHATKGDVKVLKAAISDNKAAIADNKAAIVGNKKAILDNKAAIEENTKTILANRFYLEDRINDQGEELRGVMTGLKNEILEHIDGAMKELETTRTEQTIMGHQIDDHEKRISHLEVASA